MTPEQMATDEIHELASLYSLGLLEPELATAFEKHLESGCPVCEAELRSFTETAAQIAESIEQVAPPPGLREKLLQRLPTERMICRTDQLDWQPLPFPGITAKRLFMDPVSGDITTLVRMSPGSTYPAHHHAGIEHLYMLEGDLAFRDHTLYAGDYEVSVPASDHPPVTTKNGCLVLILHHEQDRLYANA
ncbi:MAG TPA: cupin domain-containing protein [Bryobacteraceae bacterium]|nr:cupin domain-containing protein [Bryobacteraceae bacterium]